MKELIQKRGCTAMGDYKCQIPMPINGRIQGIDFCIADIVAALNASNLPTIASCCGHGNEKLARIDLLDGRVLHITGIFNTEIDDKKKAIYKDFIEDTFNGIEKKFELKE